MSHISAKNLKIKGIAAIELALSTAPATIVSVRGKDKFAVIELTHNHYLRECELVAALAETRADLAAGRVVRSRPPIIWRTSTRFRRTCLTRPIFSARA